MNDALPEAETHFRKLTPLTTSQEAPNCHNNTVTI